MTLLSIAVRSAPLDVIELLLSEEMDASQLDLLHEGASRQEGPDKTTVLKFLFARGAQVNHIWSFNDVTFPWFHAVALGTALNIAAKRGVLKLFDVCLRGEQIPLLSTRMVNCH
jgi:ankyrin repeat protein